MSAKRQPDQTRQKLLDAAFEEIHKNGFRSASLDSILSKTGVTKGALYHHFGSKTKLGYAVVEEVLHPGLAERMWAPLVTSDDPIKTAIELVHKNFQTPAADALTLGCPFNNLVQEMSSIDEGFRLRLNAILDEWRQAIHDAVRRGQTNGTIRADVSPDDAGAFIICYYEGVIGMAKATQRTDLLHSGMKALVRYLDNLRTAPTGETLSRSDDANSVA